MNDKDSFDRILEYIGKLKRKSEQYVVICGCKADESGLLSSEVLLSVSHLDNGFKGFKFVRTSSTKGLGIK